jgi:glutamyl-tRNA synthetase
MLELLRPRAKRLIDFVEQARPLLRDTVVYEPDAIAKHLATPDLHEHVTALAEALGSTTPFDEPHVEATVRGTAAERGLKAGSLIHAVRVGVTGRASSPGLFEVLVLLGPDRTVARLEELQSFLGSRL